MVHCIVCYTQVWEMYSALYTEVVVLCSIMYTRPYALCSVLTTDMSLVSSCTARPICSISLLHTWTIMLNPQQFGLLFCDIEHLAWKRWTTTSYAGPQQTIIMGNHTILSSWRLSENGFNITMILVDHDVVYGSSSAVVSVIYQWTMIVVYGNSGAMVSVISVEHVIGLW